ncbi:GAF and ANTAR domain-containing protein [Gordonia sp. SCSIO 19800]|uniref:GAF and ANTAR domain-containing protein n=1 Tax=Gordonia sp. SCSIO 19800 TaxID=2826926 RepID=UPI001B8333A8|nr:GAF and ANTAR domain-containing protein [Gordonia sp. SCSIO 19800]MBR7195280.1 GAF and ANTAR domain-containing protein [Gordonia sp. SCSIO 19800]
MPPQAHNENVDIAAQLAELAQQSAAVHSLDELLLTVTTAAVKLITGVDAADVLVIDKRKTFRSHAPTNDLPVRLDELQQNTGQGPCVDAALGHTVVRADDLTQETRWPDFSPQAVEAGVQSLLSYKLYTGNGTLGALNLFGLRANAFDDNDEELGLMLATHCAVALNGIKQQEQFTSALASRDIIGQAKGMIMERFSLDAVEAFRLLTKLSQDNNIPVTTVAAQLVEADHPRKH